MVAPLNIIWYALYMKITQDVLKELLIDAMNKPVWGARETIGIKFEMGEKVDDQRGEYHFWVSTSHWWLQQGSTREFEDIVSSESSLKNIDKKIAILNGKHLIDVEFHQSNNGVVLVFDEDLFLKILPSSGKVRDLFQLFTEDKIIYIQSDGMYQIEQL